MVQNVLDFLSGKIMEQGLATLPERNHDQNSERFKAKFQENPSVDRVVEDTRMKIEVNFMIAVAAIFTFLKLLRIPAAAADDDDAAAASVVAADDVFVTDAAVA